MELRQQMLEELIDKVKRANPEANLDLITDVYDLAYESHDGQMRNSGEPFIIHPFHVALILTELHMDTATIVSGLLHDVVEDTEVTTEDIEKRFGSSVAHIVDGVTKLTKIKFRSEEEEQAENMRKMVLAMANDIRVIVVKLADRLHNMRTLEYMSQEKKVEKANEVMEIYGPLASRLGISKLQWELEDLALRYLDYDGYYELVNKVSKRRSQREELINNLIDNVDEKLQKSGIHASISGRPKHLYSIYKKIHEQGRVFDEIYDLSAIRIMVDKEEQCYGALGVIHSMYKPIPGRFKDFIAMPKTNMYQSLHTTVIDEDGDIFEVQIRTYEMHEVAEYGIAAHWRYKEGDESGKLGPKDQDLTWVRQMLEWQQEQSDPEEFLEGLKMDFFNDEVFVFTPNGDVINLTEGSTPIDFAYMIHTEVGNTCVGAKVNGKMVALDYELGNGHIVEVITDPQSGPSLDWLKIVKTSKAKSKIRQYFNVQARERNLEIGKELVNKEIRDQGYKARDLLKDKWLELLVRRHGAGDVDDLFARIGSGNLSVRSIVRTLGELFDSTVEKSDEEIIKMAEEAKKRREKTKKRHNSLGVTVNGQDDLFVRLAGCCNPVPGDSIIGYTTRGRGVSVHRSDCVNVLNLTDKERLIQVDWDIATGTRYKGEIVIKSIPRGGLLADITNRIADSDLFIDSLDSKIDKDNISTINLVLEIKDTKELHRLMDRIRNVENVLDVYRVSS